MIHFKKIPKTQNDSFGSMQEQHYICPQMLLKYAILYFTSYCLFLNVLKSQYCGLQALYCIVSRIPVTQILIISQCTSKHILSNICLQRNWIANYLGPALEESGYFGKVKLMILDGQRPNAPRWNKEVFEGDAEEGKLAKKVFKICTKIITNTLN